MVAIGLHLVAGLEMALEILALGCHLQGMKAGFLTIKCEEIDWITQTTIEEEPSSIGWILHHQKIITGLCTWIEDEMIVAAWGKAELAQPTPSSSTHA
ncbi:hypothetical protein Pyn_08801 [Prunus yedoensis var. nudiflora]|uniref:Uncharacterized protein n=1 Tax=Prunus yedoensis var. nudiflora TaxID=2094558 RepID=A0A315AR96_PRUYE|nr:hypothetical protein Pyn_19265 [Prunus yedoensis var. nudiflora]PQQ16806.1 hypothetical protein Pyn_08801 [Prunus yedoensis var. nudiflora]